MPKTKEQIRAYNKEYSARPEVKAWAKIRNARPERRAVRKRYKQTEAAKKANLKYRRKPEVKLRVKNRRMLNRYGIGIDEYNRIYQAQGGRCAICGSQKNKLDIDHCHKTNRVRGLLCGNCNRSLGLLQDDTRILARAIKYLKLYGRTDKNG